MCCACVSLPVLSTIISLNSSQGRKLSCELVTTFTYHPLTLLEICGGTPAKLLWQTAAALHENSSHVLLALVPGAETNRPGVRSKSCPNPVQIQPTSMMLCLQLEILIPLENLLEHDSVRVQTYANASLYSLLREPTIRSVASLTCKAFAVLRTV